MCVGRSTPCQRRVLLGEATLTPNLSTAMSSSSGKQARLTSVDESVPGCTGGESATHLLGAAPPKKRTSGDVDTISSFGDLLTSPHILPQSKSPQTPTTEGKASKMDWSNTMSQAEEVGHYGQDKDSAINKAGVSSVPENDVVSVDPRRKSQSLLTLAAIRGFQGEVGNQR